MNETKDLFDVGFWSLNLEKNILECSNELFDIFELDKNKLELSYDEFINIIHPEDRNRVDKAFQKSIVDKKPYKIIFKIIMNDGRVKHLEKQCHIIFNQKNIPLVLYGVINEIPKEKISYKILEKQKLKYERLISLSSEAIFIMCPKTGKLLEHNGMASQFLGYTHKEMQNLFVYDWDKDINSIEDYHKITSSIGEEPIYIERTHTRKDKTTYIASINVKMIILDYKEYLYISVRDISEEKRLIEDNLNKERILMIQEKMASMGEMIGNIAHQWRQPLNTISVAASGMNLKYEIGMLTKKEMQEFYKAIIDSTSFLSKTIDTFRNFIKEEKIYKEVVLQDRIKEILEIMNITLKDNHIKLIDKIDYSNPIKINLIVGELAQVLLNIINNAKDILTEKKTNDPWIKLALEKLENNVIISIEDNAGGIPEDIISNIFNPYFTTKHQSKGTGLGLHMSKEIIEKHFNGKLYVKNTKNGAKFYIQVSLNN